MINGIPATTQHNNYFMTERTHVSRHPCFGDDDGGNDTFDMQNTHGQSQPYSLPGIFPTTLPEPYSKSKSPTRQSLHLTQPMLITLSLGLHVVSPLHRGNRANTTQIFQILNVE